MFTPLHILFEDKIYSIFMRNIISCRQNQSVLFLFYYKEFLKLSHKCLKGVNFTILKDT